MPDQVAWWVISVSTLRGKPWQAITVHDTRSGAEGQSQGGILAGPFTTEAGARVWGMAWSAKNHLQFTDNPNLSSGNPITSVPAGIASASNGLVHDIPGVGSVDDLINAFKNNFEHIILRLGEILVGGILIYVGVKAMATPEGQKVSSQSAKGLAKKAIRVIK